jgi:hypothetical protein
LQLVLLIPGSKFAASVIDTGGNFAIGVDTGGAP